MFQRKNVGQVWESIAAVGLHDRSSAFLEPRTHDFLRGEAKRLGRENFYRERVTPLRSQYLATGHFEHQGEIGTQIC